MLSATLIIGNSARFWKISAVGRLFGPMPRMSAPASRTRPAVGSTKPEMVRSKVVLPQPDGPRNEKNSPGAMSSVASSTDRKSVVEGKSVSVRVVLGGRRIIKKKNDKQKNR